MKRDELGEGTAHLLANYARNPTTFPFVNDTLLLSGPQAVSLEDSVDIIGRVTKKEIKIRQSSVEEWASQDSVKGASEYLAGDMAKHWATAYDALRRGEGALVTKHLRELIGREPETFEKTITGMKEA